MNDVIIISGGTIQKDFALTFLKKRIKPDTCIIAADWSFLLRQSMCRMW